MHRFSLRFAMALCMLVFACAQAAEKPPAQLPAGLDSKPLAYAPLLDAAPAALTGDLSDKAWEKAARLDFVDMQTGRPIEFATQARVFCSNDALYVGMQMDEPDFENAKHDGAIWERDSIEFFLFPGENLRGKLYYQIIVDTAKESVHHCMHMYPRHGKRSKMDSWDAEPQIAAARTKAGWAVELKIKFSDLKLSPEAAKKSALWRMALYRNRPARGGYAEQHYAWSPTFTDEQQTRGASAFSSPPPSAPTNC